MSVSPLDPSSRTQTPPQATRLLGRCWLHFLSPQPDTSLHCKTADTG